MQFGVNPANGELIEMNPRVPFLRAGFQGDRLPIARSRPSWPSVMRWTSSCNAITRETSASFEPTIDYCVVKIPRFTFEKFPEPRTS